MSPVDISFPHKWFAAMKIVANTTTIFVPIAVPCVYGNSFSVESERILL